MDTKIKIYRVGGYVRDKILGLKHSDCDYVVINSNEQQMLSLGFKKVGGSFPVFLHPKTGEEYALARTEQKISPGYRGFTTHSEQVNLVEDLSRRDLTINALAEDLDGSIIDPFGGINDIHQKILRHISTNFADDPLRVLRVARFAAKLNFTVAPETLLLMQQISKSGELSYLSRERIVSELNKALLYQFPNNFFCILLKSNSLNLIFPDLAQALIKVNVFNEFCEQLNYSNDIWFRYTLIAIYMAKTLIHQPNYSEIALDSSHLRLMRNTKLLYDFLMLDNHTNIEILTLIKSIGSLRSNSMYPILIANITLYFELNNHGKFLDKIKSFNEIISQIKLINYKQLAENVDISQQLSAYIVQQQTQIISTIKKNL